MKEIYVILEEHHDYDDSYTKVFPVAFENKNQVEVVTKSLNDLQKEIEDSKNSYKFEKIILCQ